MSKSLPILCLLLALCSLRATPIDQGNARPYIAFAQFLQDTTVDLTDGSKWAMDAGDCFPIYMFKNQQKNVVLQLGSATFTTEASRVKVLKEADAVKAQASYRKNLEVFLNGKSEKWKKEAH